MEEWRDVLDAVGSQEKAVLYQKKINGAVENFFPLITVRRKSTDAPWINARIRKLIRRWKAEYRGHGRSASWKKMKKKVDHLVKKRKENYQKSQKICLLADDGERNNFFQELQNLPNKRQASAC